MGPTLHTEDVYLRTAVAVGREGWANFGHVHLPEYRWGIFLAERNPDRTIGFGAHHGEPAWQQVPGEFRSALQRLIVIQGDTEPASVEQQRLARARRTPVCHRRTGPALLGDVERTCASRAPIRTWPQHPVSYTHLTLPTKRIV